MKRVHPSIANYLGCKNTKKGIRVKRQDSLKQCAGKAACAAGTPCDIVKQCFPAGKKNGGRIIFQNIRRYTTTLHLFIKLIAHGDNLYPFKEKDRQERETFPPYHRQSLNVFTVFGNVFHRLRADGHDHQQLKTNNERDARMRAFFLSLPPL
ncbi:MAG: hypothetical protein K5890_09500 [Bacteroidales bacterium]|nr:hypothetical protein [Bacteroidales bacterium]